MSDVLTGDARPGVQAADPDPFEAPVRTPTADVDELIVRLDGFEGPLDVLLQLAQRQKVDLRQISIATLVDQYLIFVEEAKRRDLELAADYLVMASWLTYLKSKLLLPVQKGAEDELTADDLSARLAFQLQRLDAMRKASDALLERPQLGIDVFPRGTSSLSTETETAWTADLYSLLKAYTKQRVQTIEPTVFQEDPPKVLALEEARDRLRAMLGDLPEWCVLTDLTVSPTEDIPARSSIASSFGAALEFARHGQLELRQSAPFAPLYIRRSQDDRPQETSHDHH